MALETKDHQKTEGGRCPGLSCVALIGFQPTGSGRPVHSDRTFFETSHVFEGPSVSSAYLLQSEAGIS